MTRMPPLNSVKKMLSTAAASTMRRAAAGRFTACSLRPARTFASGKTMPSMSAMGIKLVVCDMAGTTVEEHGIVYRTLREAMVAHGLTVSADEMHPWHGAAKGAVTAHFLEREPTVKVDAKAIDATFEMMVTEAYSKNGATDLISPELPAWVSGCQKAGIQVGLNTGYPVVIQEGLLSDLGLDHMVVRTTPTSARPPSLFLASPPRTARQKVAPSCGELL